MARANAAEQKQELSTPADEGRRKEADRKRKAKEQPEVQERWYEFVLKETLSKKGRKLVMKERTDTGVNTTYVGHEKKIPIAFMKKIKADGSLRG